MKKVIQTVSDSTGGVLIPDEISKATEKAFDNAYDAYYKKGGIADLKKALTEAQTGDTSIGAHLLKIGRMCLTHTGNENKSAAALFKGACAQIEHKKRDEYSDETGKKPTIQQLLPSWAPSKTTVLNALEKGLALLDEDSKGNMKYPGIGAVRTQLQAMRSAARAGGNSSNTESPVAAVTGLFKSERLKLSLEHLMKQLVTLSEQDQNQAAEILMQSSDVITQMRTDATPQEAKEVAQAEAQAAHATKEKQRRRRATRAAAEAAA